MNNSFAKQNVLNFLRFMPVLVLIVASLIYVDSIHAKGRFNLESYDWKGPIPPLKIVKVINHYGDIRSRSNSDEKVYLHASYQEIGEKPLSPEFLITEVDGILIIEIKYSESIKDINGNLRGRTDLSVLFPPRVTIIAETANGMIKVDKSKSNVEAKTTSGDIKLTTNGLFKAVTNSGKIALRLRGMHTVGESFARSQSGIISADIFQDMDLNLTAETTGKLRLNGSQLTDQALYRKQGNASSVVRLTSDSGDVEVNIIEPPQLVKSVKPTNKKVDLRNLPKSNTWKPGDPVKEINPKKDNRKKDNQKTKG